MTAYRMHWPGWWFVIAWERSRLLVQSWLPDNTESKLHTHFTFLLFIHQLAILIQTILSISLSLCTQLNLTPTITSQKVRTAACSITAEPRQELAQKAPDSDISANSSASCHRKQLHLPKKKQHFAFLHNTLPNNNIATSINITHNGEH